MLTRNFFNRMAAALTFATLCCTGLAAASPITINKAFAPNVINLGAASTVTVTLQNNDTTSNAAITAFSDDVGTTMGGMAVVDGATPAATTCVGGTPTIIGNVVSMSNGTIPMAANATTPGVCTITFRVFGNHAGNGINTILAANVATSLGGPPGDVSQTLNVQSANVTVSASATVTTIVGGTGTLTFTVTNPAAGVALTNAAFSIVGTSTVSFTVSSATSNCGGTVSVPASGTSGTISISGATIPAAGSCTVTVQTTSAVNSTVNYTLPASSVTDDQGATNSIAASNQNKFVVGNPNISKSFNPTAVLPGGTSRLTINIGNVLTAQPLTNAAITDTLPSGLTLDAVPNAVFNANCGTPAVAGASTATIAVSGATVAAGQTCSITVTVDVPGGQAAGSVTNTIPLTNFSSTEVTNAAAAATANLLVTGPGGGISIAKSASPTSAGPNVPILITLTFTSLAGGTFNSGTFVDNLPQTLMPTAVVNDGTHQPSATVGCGTPAITAVDGATSVSGSALAIPASGVCQIKFYVQFTTPTAGVSRNDTNTLVAANVSFHDALANTVSPGSNATATITELPVLTLTNYVASAQSLINQPVTETAQIVDTTGTPDTNFVATFGLTAGKVRLALTPNFIFGNTCPSGLIATYDPVVRESFTVNVGNISASCTIQYDVIDENGAAGSFSAQQPSYTSGLSGGATILATATNPVTFASSNINITKAFTPNQIQAGSTSTAGITLSVAGVSGFAQTQANGVGVPDTLPANVSFAASPNVQFSAGCQVGAQPAPGYAISGSTITFSNISLLTVGTTVQPCTASFVVTSSTLGAPVNVIGAGAVTSTSGINNSQSTSASLTVAAGIAIQKTFVAPTLPIGANGYIRFLITNSVATSVLNGGTVTDSMPAQLVLASTVLGTRQAGDPVLCGGSITGGSAGSSNFTLGGLSLPALAGSTPGQCVVYVSAGASATAAPGLVTNTIGTGGLLAGAYANQTPTSANVTLTAAPNPTLSKAFAPAQIVPGGLSTLTVTIANTAGGAAPLSALALTDTLPANVLVAPVPNATTTCGGSVSATAGGSTVALAGGSVAANATCTFSVAVTSAVSGIWTNVIAATTLTTTQGATNAAPATAALNVGNASGIGISKSFTPAMIAPGATSVVTIALANSAANAAPLSAVAFTDTLPANVTIAATPNASTTCTSGTASATAGGSTVALAGATLAINATCTISVTVTGTVAGPYTNTIPAGAIASAQASTNSAPAQAQLTIGQPSLAVTKTSIPSASTVSPGQSVAYTIVVRNGGTQAETNARITDTLGNATLVPGSVAINGVAFPDAVVSAAQAFGTLALGATDTITYSATVNAAAPVGSSVTNTAAIGGDQPCTGAACSSTSAANTVAPPLLTATKLIDGLVSEPVLAGQVVTYGIAVKNTGAGPAINTVLTDPVPAGVTVVPGSITIDNVNVPAATIAGQTLTVPLGMVNAGAAPVVAFKATIGAAAGALSNTVTIMATGLASAVQSTTASARQVPATIIVTKTASAATVTVGDRVDFTITAAPAGGVAYGLTTLVDTLPDYEVYAPGTARVAGRAQEPSVQGHVLTWTVPSLSAPVTITYATAIAPGAPSNGALTNVVNATAVAPGGAGLGRGSASATVLVVGSTFGSCYPITGRVYLDLKGSGHFEDPNVGLSSVHIYLDNGESVVTDRTGRYDFPCVHPGMHALRLDGTTLPAGVVPYGDRNIDSEKSSRRLVHHIYDTTIIEDINFAVTGTPDKPLDPGSSPSR